MKTEATKIKKLGKVVTGKTPPTSKLEFFDGEYPFLTPSDIVDYKVRHLTTVGRTVSEEWKKKAKKYLLPKNTVCYVCIGSTVGKICMVEKESFSNQQINSIVCDRTVSDPFYVFYLLRTKLAWIKMIADSSGAGKGIINKTTFENLELKVSDLPTQQSLADVIKSYDDLIENNERRIKILEEMAQRLYTEWFVKFKFPGHEKVTFIDSGTKFGKIPEGWEVKNIGDMLARVKRKTKIPSSEYLEDGKFPVVDQGNDFIAGFTDDEMAVYDEELIVFGDHSRCFKYCNFEFACGADGTQLLLSNNLQRMPQKLFYLTAMNAGLQNFGYARHFKFLKALKIVVPDEDTANKFSSMFDNAFSQTRQLKQQSAVLAKMRDLLIPQLVTGKRDLK